MLHHKWSMVHLTTFTDSAPVVLSVLISSPLGTVNTSPEVIDEAGFVSLRLTLEASANTETDRTTLQETQEGTYDLSNTAAEAKGSKAKGDNLTTEAKGSKAKADNLMTEAKGSKAKADDLTREEKSGNAREDDLATEAGITKQRQRKVETGLRRLQEKAPLKSQRRKQQ